MKLIRPKILKKGAKRRYGRGFSREELKKAGLSLQEALKLGVSVDSRRRTAREENVEAVKTFLETAKQSVKPKKKPKSSSRQSEK